jgi:ATP-dependent DNA helicase RecG
MSDWKRSLVIKNPDQVPAHPLAQTSELAAEEVTTEVTDLLNVIAGEMSRQELQTIMGLKSTEHFRKAYVLPVVASEYLHRCLIATTCRG